MPTGYTAAVVDGKITTFPAFALSCARAFGALIEMRDDPSDAPLPETIKPQTTYNEQSAAQHKTRIAELEAMTAEQAEAAAHNAYDEAATSRDEYLARRRVETERLTTMLRQVRAWAPPTPDHQEMKKFMVDQLTISLPGNYAPAEPVLLDGETWRVRELKSEKEGLARDEKQIAEAVERAKGRDGWLQALRASLADHTGGQS